MKEGYEESKGSFPVLNLFSFPKGLKKIMAEQPVYFVKNRNGTYGKWTGNLCKRPSVHLF